MPSPRKVRRIAAFVARYFPDGLLRLIVDARSLRGRRWKILMPLLRVALVGLACGCHGLGEVEEMTEDMPRWVRKLLGIGRKLPDTTLREVLCQLDPNDLCDLLVVVGYDAWRRKALRHDDQLPWGVLSLDGKYPTVRDTGESERGRYEFLQVHHDEAGSPSHGTVRTITCSLITAAGRPILGAVPVPGDTNEVGHFQKAFGDMVRMYGRLFRVVMYDAGGASQGNAKAVLAAGKQFVIQIADPNWVMYRTVEMLFKAREPDIVEEQEESSDKLVVRYLTLLPVRRTRKNLTIWKEVNCVVKVYSETYEYGELAGTKTRYYVSSLAATELTPTQWLKLTILRWGVESCHQILDTAFLEDKRPWVTADAQGALAVMLLRRVVYTTLTLFRSVTLRSEDHRLMPWRKLMKWLRQALEWPNPVDVEDLRPRTFAVPPALA
jgi:hypothetical protein